MQACAAGYALTYSATMKLQLVTWTFIGLAAAKFKLSKSQSQSHIATDRRSVNLSWCRAERAE
jgi:hypothetical protein